MPAPGGVSAPRGVSASGGMSASGGGVSAIRGYLLSGGVSQHALRQTPPCGQTHACKNITFATSLWTVIRF